MTAVSFLRVRAVARKEFLHVLRDPRSLGMAIGMPLIMLILFGYALTFDVDNVPLVVWDQSRTQASRDLAARFTGSRYFALAGTIQTYPELERAIDTGQALIALVIPTDFARNLEAGRTAPVQVIADGSDANTATLALNYADAVVQAHSQHVILDRATRLAGPAADRLLRPPLDLRPRVWFNDDMEFRNAIVPGLIAVLMMVIAALLTSLTVAREWELGTMEQLISTPVRPHELLVGKFIPYFVIGMLDVLFAVLMSRFLFNVPLRGSVLLLFFMAAMFLTGTLSLGLLISVVTRNQLLATQLAMVATFLPSFLLSGFIAPIGNMPHVIQQVSYIVPARYFVDLLRGIYMKGVGLETLWPQALFLAAFTVVMVFLANMKLKKKLQ